MTEQSKIQNRKSKIGGIPERAGEGGSSHQNERLPVVSYQFSAKAEERKGEQKNLSLATDNCLTDNYFSR
jgi:hypothetical protein